YGGARRGELHDIAVSGTESLLEACSRQGVARVGITSSSVVFGYSRAGTDVHEELPVVAAPPEPAYVAAKIAQHRRALMLGEYLGLDIRLACPTMTIGPTSSSLGPSNGMIVAYLSDPFRCTFPGGCNIVAARDVANGHIIIAERGVAGESYLLG